MARKPTPEPERPEYQATGAGYWPGGARFPWIRLVPMTAAQRDALPDPVPDGVVVFAAGKLQVRADGAWVDI
jgi:hypothetical protein